MGRSARQKNRRDSFFAGLFRKLFDAAWPLRTDAIARKPHGVFHRRLRFEGCEDRRLLAVGVSWTAPTLTLTGSTSADDVRVVGRTNYVEVFVGGTFQTRIQGPSSSTVGTINFNGGGSTDSLTVQNIWPAGGLTLALTDVENLSVVKGVATTVTSNTGLNLGTSSFAGALSVTTTGAGNLTQTGAISVTGLTRLDVDDGDITLANAANNFSTVEIVANNAAGQDVSITDANAVRFVDSGDADAFALQVTGNLTVNANLNATNLTAISQTAILDVDGTTTLTVGSASTITLNTAGNSFTGAVSITAARNATLRNNAATGTGFGDSNVTQDLTVYDTNAASDGITQSGRLVVGRVASFNASAGDILLENDDNNFGTISLDADTAAGQDASVADANALILGTVSVSGTLTVTTDGAITQSGTITVPNDLTSLNAGEVNDITLAKSTNDFSSVQVLDTANTASGARNVALRDTNRLDLDESIISGTLTVTSGGTLGVGITDLDYLEVAGKTTLAAGSGNSIVLDGGTNDFSEVAVASGGAVTLVDENELILGTSRISGTLAVTTTGDLTQSGQVVVTSGTTLNANAGDITLDNANNDFKSTVDVTANDAGQNVSLRDTNAMVIVNADVGGNLTLQANRNSSNRVALSQTGATGPIQVLGTTTLTVGSASTISLASLLVGNSFGGAISVTAAKDAAIRNTGGTTDLGDCSVTGNLTVTSTAGAITDSGSVVVGKVATFTATGLDVTLDDDQNNFGTVFVSGADVTLVDLNALILGTSTVTGNLFVDTEGAITQSGALNIDGNTTLTAGHVGHAYDITLLNAGNDFGDDPTTNWVRIAYAGNVALRDGTAVGGASVGLGGTGGSTIAGTLAVTTAGSIAQLDGALDVAGRATFTAGSANDIFLDAVGLPNNFSEVAVVSGDEVFVNNSEALILGPSKITTSLTVTTSDDSVTQSGAVVVPVLNVDADDVGAGAGDVVLTNAGNNFMTATVSGNDIELRDISAIELGESTALGTLSVTAGAAITQTGVLTVTGAATFATNANADVTLTEDNLFSEVTVTSGKNVSIIDANALELGESTISGALTVATSGNLTQSGKIVVSGLTTLDVGTANDITLEKAGNNFATIQVNAGNTVSLVDTSGIVLVFVDVEGDLTIEAGGSITDTGTIRVGDIGDQQTTTLTANGDILLDEGDAEFYGTLSLWGEDVEVTNDASDGTLGTLLGDCTATGNLTVYSTGGNLTNDANGDPPGGARGILTVTGTAKLHALGGFDAIFYKLGVAGDDSEAGSWDVFGDAGTVFDTTTAV